MNNQDYYMLGYGKIREDYEKYLRFIENIRLFMNIFPIPGMLGIVNQYFVSSLPYLCSIFSL